MLETIIDIENKHTLFDYLSAMCIEGYGGKIKTDDTKLRARIDKTKPFVKSVIKAKSTQDVINILDKKVYPVIKDLLEEAESGFKEVSERFTKGVAKESMAVAELSIKEEGHDGLKSTQYVSAINEFGDRVGEVKTLTPRVKSSGRSNATMPPKWTDGDYAALKESVNSSVRELIRKMTFIRKQDSVPRWIGHQRVGKINTRGIYKYKTGSQKIFKKKIEMPDRIANFAFSAVIDVSGSMEGDRIIHTTRGLVLLSEVFDKMKIPFEIVAFSNGASVVKGFNEDYDNAKKKQLGGLVKDFRGGGTNLDEAFKAITIKQCSERNKIMILLSDGGVGSKEFYDSYFKDFEKHKIQTIGVGLCCGNEIVDLCKGNGFVTDEVGKLPLKFVELLKSIIK